MKILKHLAFVSLLALSVIACQNEGQTQNNDNSTDQAEINRKNDEHIDGDHVKSASEIPVLTPEQKQEYINRSKQIAQSAVQIFTGHLKRLLGEKKPGEALEYCHTNALKITDSLAKANQVSLKRTSYRLRTPKNKPTTQEEKVMEIFRKQILKNLKPAPYMHYDNEGYPHVYIPIMVQQKCLMCHGDPNKDIPEVINQKLSELYPSDKAIFFKEGDLRGIWSIRFPKKSEK